VEAAPDDRCRGQGPLRVERERGANMGSTPRKFPKDFIGGNGPDNLKTEAQVMRCLKDSYALAIAQPRR
jgi:hypothetical protein